MGIANGGVDCNQGPALDDCVYHVENPTRAKKGVEETSAGCWSSSRCRSRWQGFFTGARVVMKAKVKRRWYVGFIANVDAEMEQGCNDGRFRSIEVHVVGDNM